MLNNPKGLSNSIDSNSEGHIAYTNNLELEYINNVSYLAKVRQDQRLIDKFNRSMTRVLNREWQGLIDRAIKAGIKEFDGERSVNQVARITASVERVVNQFSPKSRRIINKQIETIYETLIINFVKKFNIKVKKAVLSLGPRATIDFSLRDQKAIDAIGRLTNQTAGSLFPEQVMNKVAMSVSDVVFEQGLNIEEASRRLSAELSTALGSDKIKVIPTRFQTNPQDYFDTLSNNASLLSNNVGSMVAMQEAGVEKYRVVIVEDKRTSNICRAMKNRVISVASGIKMVDKVLGFTNPRQLKSQFPWNSKRTASTIGPRTLSNNNKLAESGLGFPPYHGKCRSIVVPVFD